MNNDYLKQAINWQDNADAEFPFQASWQQHRLLIRLNDFPAQSLYSLIVDEQVIIDFDDWPSQWRRP